MEAVSLRERKKAATRRQLMTVALRLFDTQGFDNTTVEQIAAAADVAPRTFFRYFPTKVDVLFGDHDELVALLRQTLATCSDDEPIIDAVRRATLEGIGKVVADPSLFLTRSRLAASVPAAHAHSRYLDAEYEDVIARAAWSATRAARDIWVESDAKRDPRTLVNQAFDLLEHDLRAERTASRSTG
jgi:AcrR family transcriptional regulator